MLHIHAPRIQLTRVHVRVHYAPRGVILVQARGDLPIHCPFAKVGGNLGVKLSQFRKERWKKVLQLNNLGS